MGVFPSEDALHCRSTHHSSRFASSARRLIRFSDSVALREWFPRSKSQLNQGDPSKAPMLALVAWEEGLDRPYTSSSESPPQFSDAQLEAMQSWPATVPQNLLAHSLSLLPEPQRQVVLDWFYSGSSIDEIAKQHSLSPLVVRQELKEGLVRLKELLAEATL